MCVTTFHCARFFHLPSYEKEGRLTVTDHSQNLSRTYEGPTNIIPAFLSTDFSIDDHIHVGGLPDGAMVSKFCYNSWMIATDQVRCMVTFWKRARSGASECRKKEWD